jgi:long-subunit fatty acid transport protein
MKVVRTVVGAAAVAVCCGLGSGQAFAQSNDEVFPQFQWNFSTPGARANAMGRAFIGTADDASASITNPAGLVRLTRPQGYFEFKATDLKVERLAAVDSLFTLRPTETSQKIGSPSFFSVSMPIMKKYAVAFTMHEFLNYRETFTLDPRPIPDSDNIFFGVQGDTDFKARSFAGSFAATLSPQLFVGVTVSSDRLTGTSTATRFGNEFHDSGNQFTVTASPIKVNETSIDDTASGTSMIVGALFLPNDKVTVGVQFATGASMEVDESLNFNPSTTTNQTLELASGFPKTITINVPHRFGAGVSVRPTPRLLTSFDFVYIGYSRLANDFTVIFDTAGLDGSEFEVDDAVETHFGAEYLLMQGRNSIFLRGGAYTAPNHNTRFTGSSDPNADAAQNAIYNLLPRDTEVIGTVGIGFVLGSRAQADFAVVGKAKEFVASIGVRF